MFQPDQQAKVEQAKREAEAQKQRNVYAAEIEQVQQEKITLEEEQKFRKGTVNIKDIIAPAAMEVNPRYIKLGDKFVSTIFVLTYPRYLSVGWFAPVINLNEMLDIGMYFYPVNTEVVLKQLKKRVGNLEAELYANIEKGAPRDPILETALRDMERLRDDLTQGIEKFFQFALYVTLYAQTEDELDKLIKDVESTFGSKLIYTKQVFYQAEQGFNSTLPLMNDEIEIPFNMNSSPVASSFPFISAELTSDEGVLYGINRHNNSLIIFDRFSLQNANSVVFATSGAGKSYAIKLEVLRSLMFGTEVIIIDPEMEYNHLSDAVGGTYINISLSSEAKINPFDLPRAIGDATTEDVIRSAVIVLKGLLRIMLGDFTYQEDSIMDQALLETYAKKDITPDADLSKIEPPILSDLKEILEGIEGSGDLPTRLEKFTDGTFSGLLNAPTNVDLKNQLVTFSVRDLEDELRPVAIYTIVNYIWNVVRSERKRRILVIDEAWWLMQNEDSAKFIFALAKRARKYYLGVTTITQDVNDFLNNDYGRAIVTNSAMQLLLKQTTAAVDRIADVFQLTEGEKFLLLEAGPGEGIFFAGQKHAAIKVVASYSEHQLVTTDPRQLLEIEREKQKFKEQLERQQGGNAQKAKEDRAQA